MTYRLLYIPSQLRAGTKTSNLRGKIVEGNRQMRQLWDLPLTMRRTYWRFKNRAGGVVLVGQSPTKKRSCICTNE